MRILSQLRRRRGLTLMELIVVIAILVALAGILIPLFPSMIGRAHTSTGATNDSETTKAVQIYEATYFNYPSQFDSLLGTGGTALFTKLPGGGLVGGTTELTTAALTAGTADALVDSGIAGVWDLDDATTEPTFNPYGAARAPVVTGNVAVLGSAAIARMNLNPLETYVVLGLGRKCTMMGTTMTDPPVHFADEQNNTQDKVYGLTAGQRLVALSVGPRNKVYGLTAGQRLVALSVGPRNSAIGKLITNCPTYPGADGKYYGRYVAVFIIYASWCPE